MPTEDVIAVGSTGLFAESISDARRFRLKQSLLALANWAEARAGGNHNTETTMTMLERRLSEIRDQVDRAGWAASNSANASDHRH
jgi:ATP-dependent protease HslVU (ClpYQ) peptidase subunit